MIEHQTGRFEGARIAYAWFSLLSVPRTREPILAGILRYALAPLQAPPVRAKAHFTPAPPKLDGELEDACWSCPAAVRRFLPSAREDPTATGPDTRARFCWTRNRLYIALECPGPGDTIRLRWGRDTSIRSRPFSIRTG